MPDPIRVTRAVRRCPWSDSAHREGVCDMPNCTDGWVDVPVDEECPTCHTRHGGVCCPGRKYLGETWTSSGDALTTPTKVWAGPCPDCNGSGRRLHDWATGWCVGDEVLMPDGSTESIQCSLDVIDLGRIGALVLSDPSHRPEPMRWKQ